MVKLNTEIDKYQQELSEFITKHDLPKEWFMEPDHIAFKGADTKDFEGLAAYFKPLAVQVSCVDMDGRRLATAKLTTPVNVGQFGSVQWVEIMEPRPEKVGKDVVGFEHMEFYFPGFEQARKILEEKGIDYKMEQNPGHQWVNIVINSGGQELKLNNRTLGDIVEKELASKVAYLL